MGIMSVLQLKICSAKTLKATYCFKKKEIKQIICNAVNLHSLVSIYTTQHLSLSAMQECVVRHIVRCMH